MIRRLAPLLAVVAALAAQVPRAEDADRLLRRGNAAAARGDWAAAAAWYEKAEPLSLEPGLVAFNVATARYHLAAGDSGRDLPAAEVAYRSCLGRGDPRRGRALFGLGNCLLLRAAPGGALDGPTLRAAIDCYIECRREPDCDATLAESARHNEQRARLLLLQVVPRPDGPPKDGGDGPGEEEKPQPPPTGTSGDGDREKSAGTDKVPVPDDGKAQPTDDKGGPPQPGKGKLGPVPDQPFAVPLPAREAAEEVDQAARRVVEELRQYRRSQARPRQGARDW